MTKDRPVLRALFHSSAGFRPTSHSDGSDITGEVALSYTIIPQQFFYPYSPRRVHPRLRQPQGQPSVQVLRERDGGDLVDGVSALGGHLPGRVLAAGVVVAVALQAAAGQFGQVEAAQDGRQGGVQRVRGQREELQPGQR